MVASGDRKSKYEAVQATEASVSALTRKLWMRSDNSIMRRAKSFS